MVMSRIVTPTNQVQVLTRGFLICLIGDWCNGSTVDFESISGGSNPSSPVFLMFFWEYNSIGRIPHF